ncbi:hypothetical protein [Neobacillus niacini]|uniref:hypothetical protein n=1 Tax=Neobacillus niacini TaxID=86668 RepID=UPI0021CB2718|nr:hypothetical protein [Neobacillus niacini]MCM3764389.1 hypothetical protein [Neobacillus niacini]
MNSKGTLSKSGVFVYESYKDNIIIDKYNRVFSKMRVSKLEAIRSINSEDAMTWNAFRTLQKIDPEIWLPLLFQQTFQEQRCDLVENMKISLWKKLSPPVEWGLREGDSEIDVMLENDHFVWFIEVKYKSDVSMGTTHDKARNQILRNIDLGTDYSGDKDFYFSLVILDEKHSPKGIGIIEKYGNSVESVGENLPHRGGQLPNLKKISLLKWQELRDLFGYCEEHAQYEDEQLLSRLAKNDLERRIIGQ